jgi:hypothetical protein
MNIIFKHLIPKLMQIARWETPSVRQRNSIEESKEMEPRDERAQTHRNGYL